MKRRTSSETRTFRLEVIESRQSDEYRDDEPGSLSGVRVVDAVGETVEEQTKPLAKCRQLSAFPWAGRKVGT